MGQIIAFPQAGKAGDYHYAVYEHRLVSPEGIAYPRYFIVLKNSYGVIVRFTKLHRFTGVYEGRMYKPLASNPREKMIYITRMLNYILIEHHEIYGVDHVFGITKDMLSAFFMNYALSEKRGGGHRGGQDVEKCIVSVTGFFSRLYRKYTGYMSVTPSELYSDRKKMTRYGKPQVVSIPDFQVSVIPEHKEVFRDMPTKVFQILMNLAVRYTPGIAFAMALSAFAGLRPGEVMNVRQEQSPKAPGLILTYRGSRLTRADIDLTHEYVMRSDGVTCGMIKRERTAHVYPPFLGVFERVYDLHKEYLNKHSFEQEYSPMFINNQGKAMTYQTYYSKFVSLVQNQLRPLLLSHEEPECRIYGQLLCENTLGPHSLRHWFSVQLALRGEDVANLQFWRGDKSPESAFLYLQNKGDLVRELSAANDMLAEALMKEGEIIFEQ